MAFDAFLKLDGIEGESTDDNHKGWVELLSYSWGATQPTSISSATGGRTAERVNIQDFSFVKAVDRSSPHLFLACCDGRHLKEVVLELCQAAGDKHSYMKVKFQGAIVSSYRPGGSAQGGETKPLEEVALNFGKVQLEYTPVDHMGKAGSKIGPMGWDLEANKKL